MIVLPAVIAAIALAVAGHPVEVRCDAGATNPFAFEVYGWANLNANEIHLQPGLCLVLQRRPDGTQPFAIAFGTLVHESVHARGIRAEDCAELWADLASFDLLQRFYGIPMFSYLSRVIGAGILYQTHLKPPSYQPTALSCAGGH